MLTGTYTLEHASWEHLSNETPEQQGITEEQADELLQLVDAEWERTVTETGHEYGVELEVRWVDASSLAYHARLDEEDWHLEHEIETAIIGELEKATERATDTWSKRITESELE